MSDKPEDQQVELSPEAATIMDELVEIARTAGLQPDPAKITHTALAMMRAVLEDDLVAVPRAAALAAGLDVTPLGRMH